MVTNTMHTAQPSQTDRDSNGIALSPVGNQNGSVMILALMIMAVMMVIVIASSDTVVTENFIMRNVGIHKQNVNLVEAALMEGLQTFMQIPNTNPANFSPDISNTDWINNRNDAWTTANWYNTGDVATQLNANNSIAASLGNPLTTLGTRGEAAGVLRYAVVGWEPVVIGTGGSESLVVGAGATWYGGRIIGEYVSADAGNNDNGNGFLRMELGVKRQW